MTAGPERANPHQRLPLRLVAYVGMMYVSKCVVCVTGRSIGNRLCVPKPGTPQPPGLAKADFAPGEADGTVHRHCCFTRLSSPTD